MRPLQLVVLPPLQQTHGIESRLAFEKEQCDALSVHACRSACVLPVTARKRPIRTASVREAPNTSAKAVVEEKNVQSWLECGLPENVKHCTVAIARGFA